jgi:phosphoesterase RecJ-like protein
MKTGRIQLIKTTVAEIGRNLKSADRILLISHIRPDGDAVGSLLGFGLALRAVGKNVQLVLADGIPSAYKHLKGWDTVRKQPVESYDLSIVLDCSDIYRVGDFYQGYQKPDINIDHHKTNLFFAKINLVDQKAVATAEIITQHLDEWDLPLEREVADALLTGLITDSLGFRTGNMSPDAFRTAARLLETGSRLSYLYNKVLINRTFEATKLWGAGLTSLQREGPLVWTTLTVKDRRNSGYPGNDDGDLINILSSIEDAKVSIIFVEQPYDKVKVSWRADPDIDITPLALFFGGGGHPAASGAEISGDINSVRSQVLEKTQDLIADIMIKNRETIGSL